MSTQQARQTIRAPKAYSRQAKRFGLRSTLKVDMESQAALKAERRRVSSELYDWIEGKEG